MQLTTIPASDTITACPAIPIWPAPLSVTDDEQTAPDSQVEPFPPSVIFIKVISAADFKRRTGRPEGSPLALVLEPVEVRPDRITLPPFLASEHTLTVASCAKPVYACGPIKGGPVAIYRSCQDGLMKRSRRAPGGEIAPALPFARQPHIDSEPWQALALKPSDPLEADLTPIVFGPVAGTSAEIRRPKQALRELVLPSPRPWYTLSILWQSFRGFPVAVPAAEAAASTCVQALPHIICWDSVSELVAARGRLLRESVEIGFQLSPSIDGARARCLAVMPVEVVTPLAPGLTAPFQGSKPSVESPAPFTKAVAETMPVPRSIDTPAPIIGLSKGLSIWVGTVNSYAHRYWCSPRLREGGRVVHTLRLAPSTSVKEACEISAA